MNIVVYQMYHYTQIIERKKNLYALSKCLDSKKMKEATGGNLESVLANINSFGDLNSAFKQSDLNKNGRIDPHEIDDNGMLDAQVSTPELCQDILHATPTFLTGTCPT